MTLGEFALAWLFAICAGLAVWWCTLPSDDEGDSLEDDL